jgi:hypothetical protein
MKKFNLIIFFIVFNLNFVFTRTGIIDYLNSCEIKLLSVKVIIAHNGDEEILVLSNVLSTRSSKRILRFTPLPSKPEVTIPQTEIISNIADYINTGGIKTINCYKGKEKIGNGNTYQVPPNETKPLKSTVLEVMDSDHFMNLLSELNRKMDSPVEITDSQLEQIMYYIKQGYKFFIVDLIDLNENVSNISPLVYKFKTDELYFPLKLMNLYKNKGKLDIIVLSESEETLDNFSLFLPCKEYENFACLRIAENEFDQFHIFSGFFEKEVCAKVFSYWGNFDFKNNIEIKNIIPTKMNVPKKKQSTIAEEKPPIKKKDTPRMENE